MTAKKKPAVTEVADGRSKAARRMKELIQNFTAEIGGGELSPSEETIVENAAMARMKSEDVRARMADGEDLFPRGHRPRRPADQPRHARPEQRQGQARRRRQVRHEPARPAPSPRSRPSASPSRSRNDDEDEVEPVEAINHVTPKPRSSAVQTRPPRSSPPSLEAGRRARQADRPAQDPVAVWYDARPGAEPGKTLHADSSPRCSTSIARSRTSSS